MSRLGGLIRPAVTQRVGPGGGLKIFCCTFLQLVAAACVSVAVADCS